MFLVCHVISQDQVIKRSCNSVYLFEEAAHSKLPSCKVYGHRYTLIVYIMVFHLSRDLVGPRDLRVM